MIRGIAKNMAHKPLVKEKEKLDLKLMYGLELIKESNSMISELSAEIAKLKSHWTHKLYNFFK